MLLYLASDNLILYSFNVRHSSTASQVTTFGGIEMYIIVIVIVIVIVICYYYYYYYYYYRSHMLHKTAFSSALCSTITIIFIHLFILCYQSRNLIDRSLAEDLSFYKIWYKSVNNFSRYTADRQTNKQTDARYHTTSVTSLADVIKDYSVTVWEICTYTF